MLLCGALATAFVASLSATASAASVSICKSVTPVRSVSSKSTALTSTAFASFVQVAQRSQGAKPVKAAGNHRTHRLTRRHATHKAHRRLATVKTASPLRATARLASLSGNPEIVSVTATGGVESVTLSWGVTGEANIAHVIAKVGSREVTLPASVRSYTFTSLPAGSYSFTVTPELGGLGASASGTAVAQPGSSGGGQVRWYGDFSSGFSSALYPLQSYVAGHATVVADPLGSGQKVLDLAVADSDRPYTGAVNPRADFESPKMFTPGSDAYIAIPTLLPSGFPVIDWHKGWMQVAELYGQPYGGSPPIGIGLTNYGTGINHYQLSDHASKVWWQGPSIVGGWHTVTLHVHFATDNTGSVELWYDGAQQKFTNGATKLNYPTLLAGVNWDGTHGNFLNINNYRSAGSWPGTVTLFHGAPTVATTLAAAESTPTP